MLPSLAVFSCAPSLQSCKGIHDEAHRVDTIYAPITFIGKVGENDAFREVYGVVSDGSLDSDKQKADLAWLAGALPAWFNEWGNIREMHRPSAVGKGIELTDMGNGQWQLRARIVDENAIKLVDNSIYQGYSIGVIWPKLAKDATAPGGRIVGGEIVEVSLVDRPSNTNSKFVIAKAAIPHKDGEPKTPPKGFPQQVDTDHYADPANKSWPIDSDKRIHSAVSYYNAGGKAKDPYNADEWATIGKRIAAAANKAFGGGYALEGGKITTPSDKKFADVADKLTAHLTKGEPNQDQADVFEVLKLNELDDAQLFLFMANLTRYAMIRRLHEEAEPNQALEYFMQQLGQIYDYFMQCSQNEYSEAWSYLSGQIIQQLLTSHTLGQTIADAAAGIDQQAEAGARTDGVALKYGKTLSQKSMSALRDSHDALTKMTDGALCTDYVNANLGGGPDGTGGGQNADQEVEMTTKEIEAMVAKAASAAAEAALAKQAAAATTALGQAGETPTVPHGTQAPGQTAPPAQTAPEPGQIVASEIPDFTELLKQALAPVLEQNADLAKRLSGIEERASDEGPLVTAMQKQLSKSVRSARAEELDALIADREERVRRHPDPAMRALAAAELAKFSAERSVLSA